MDPHLQSISEQVGAALSARKLMLACAESCTGGWISQAVTAISGSSEWFDRGFITYSNVSKQDMLEVRGATLREQGAVSEAAAAEMAEGALAHSRAGIALAVTGIAGPKGGSPDKPVGTICFAWCLKGANPVTETRRFYGDRQAIRRQAVVQSLLGILRLLGVNKH